MSSRFDDNHNLPHAHREEGSNSESNFVPANFLENALVEAEAGRLEYREFFKIFVDSQVYEIAAAAPQGADDPVFPLSFQDPEQGRMIAVFSDPSRTIPFQKQAPHILPLKGSQVLETIPAGFGVMLNPGSAVRLTIPGYGVLNIRRDFGIARV